jgi:hypothetical protein
VPTHIEPSGARTIVPTELSGWNVAGGALDEAIADQLAQAAGLGPDPDRAVARLRHGPHDVRRQAFGGGVGADSARAQHRQPGELAADPGQVAVGGDRGARAVEPGRRGPDEAGPVEPRHAPEGRDPHRAIGEDRDVLDGERGQAVGRGVAPARAVVVEAAQAVVAARDPQAARAHRQRPQVVTGLDAALEPAHAGGADLAQPGAGGDHDRVVAAHRDGDHLVARVALGLDPAARRDQAMVGAPPQPAVTGARHGAHARVSRDVRNPSEVAMDQREGPAALGPDRDPAGAVGLEGQHRRARQVAVDDEAVAVEADQPLLGAEPEEAVAILGDRGHRVLRQAVVGAPARDLPRVLAAGRLGRHRRSEDQRDPHGS